MHAIGINSNNIIIIIIRIIFEFPCESDSFIFWNILLMTGLTAEENIIIMIKTAKNLMYILRSNFQYSFQKSNHASAQNNVIPKHKNEIIKPICCVLLSSSERNFSPTL